MGESKHYLSYQLIIWKNVTTCQWLLMNAERRKTSNARQRKTKWVNKYVWSAPAAGLWVHNDKAYNLSC